MPLEFSLTQFASSSEPSLRAGFGGLIGQEEDVPLGFPGRWRFEPPPDAGGFVNRVIPDEAVEDVIGLTMRVATQGNRREVLEHFKGYFCRACGVTHVWSSNTGWAETDLRHYARQAAQNAPLFIEAFYDACEAFRDEDPDVFSPDVTMINDLLARHSIGYEIRVPRLELRDAATSAPLVAVEAPPATLTERAAGVLAQSLDRSEQLLRQGRCREAVQESLWLLESIATAFRGIETASGTIEGGYFNQIARELGQAVGRGTTLERALAWVTALHGYLSSPTGGGVRHGLDLNSGVAIGPAEARLFCNLIRSYLSFLLSEHERLSRRPGGQ